MYYCVIIAGHRHDFICNTFYQGQIPIRSECLYTLLKSIALRVVIGSRAAVSHMWPFEGDNERLGLILKAAPSRGRIETLQTSFPHYTNTWNVTITSHGIPHPIIAVLTTGIS